VINLTRKHLAESHRVSSDRITQWLCLLKMPEDKLYEIAASGDHLDRKIISEKKLRAMKNMLR
jgi:hypothetical protein